MRLVRFIGILNIIVLGTLLLFFILHALSGSEDQPQSYPMITTNSYKDNRINVHKPIELCSQDWEESDLLISDGTSNEIRLPCKNCKLKLNQLLKSFSKPWLKDENQWNDFRSKLKRFCNGTAEAIITQANSPVGTVIPYAGERKRSLQVTTAHFRTFVKDNPFSNKTLHTCAVIGNSAVLADSNCGKTIDSADFVIRCNLPPLGNRFSNHVGTKTDLVTVNPSTLEEKFDSLVGRRRLFVENLCQYGNAMMLIPAFTFHTQTPPSLRAIHTVKDFESPVMPIFLNPVYSKNLSEFWKSQGLKKIRLSSGFMMTNLALELCENVHLYGFWPFNVHPHSFKNLTKHYFDQSQAQTVRSWTPEFNHLKKLHNKGVVKIHLGVCKSD